MSEDTCVGYVRTGARRAGPPGPDRERPALVGDRGLGRALLRRSHPAGRRRRPRDAADRRVRREHAASRTHTTSPGSWPPCSTARPARRCSTPTTPNGGRSGPSPTEQAYTRYVLRLDPSLGKENLMPIVDEAAVELGYRQLSGAVQARGRRRRRSVGGPARADGASGHARAASRRRPGRQRRSRHSTSSAAASSLLAGPDGSGWCAGGGARPEQLGVPLDAYRAGADFADGSGRFEELYGIGARGRGARAPRRLRRLAHAGRAGERERHARGRARHRARPPVRPRPAGDVKSCLTPRTTSAENGHSLFSPGYGSR